MILLPRLRQLVQHATALEWRAASAAACSVAAVFALSVGLPAARSTPVGTDLAARRVALETHGDLREAALAALAARMDPAALALAGRFDPEKFTAEVPPGELPAGDHAILQLQEAGDAAARAANAAIPFAADVTPAPPFILRAVSHAEHERAVRCLTNAIYYEAALEPVEGQRAVAQVVLNRVRDPDFPRSICGVVYQGWDRVTGCQFSFTCDGAQVRTPIAAIWNQNRKVAEAALKGYVMGAIGMATHYHADYISPYWAPTLVKVSQIGQHIFYRWPGGAGQVAAFTAAYGGGEGRISEAVLSGAAARATAAAASAPTSALVAAAGLRGAIPPGAVHTVIAPDGQGGTKTRVQASFLAAASPSGEYGRRQATPEEIARINAILEERFPTNPPAPPAAQAPAKPAEAATSAPASTAVADAG